MYCEACWRPVPNDAAFCPSCGARVRPDSSEATTQAEECTIYLWTSPDGQESNVLVEPRDFRLVAIDKAGTVVADSKLRIADLKVDDLKVAAPQMTLAALNALAGTLRGAGWTESIANEKVLNNHGLAALRVNFDSPKLKFHRRSETLTQHGEFSRAVGGAEFFVGYKCAFWYPFVATGLDGDVIGDDVLERIIIVSNQWDQDTLGIMFDSGPLSHKELHSPKMDSLESEMKEALMATGWKIVPELYELEGAPSLPTIEELNVAAERFRQSGEPLPILTRIGSRGGLPRSEVPADEMHKRNVSERAAELIGAIFYSSQKPQHEYDVMALEILTSAAGNSDQQELEAIVIFAKWYMQEHLQTDAERRKFMEKVRIVQSGGALSESFSVAEVQWELCEIEARKTRAGLIRNDKYKLFAVATGPRGRYDVASSWDIPVSGAFSIEEPDDHAAKIGRVARDELVHRLIAEGWNSQPSGPHWYSQRFRRRVR